MRGTVWSASGHALQQVLRLASNLILTRLLFEEAFGLMLLVNAFLQGLQTFSDIGINACIVQNRRGDDRRFLDTAWTLQVLRAAILFAVCLALTAPVTRFYGHAELATLIPVAGLTVLVTGFCSTSLATLERHIDLGRLTVMTLLIQVVSLGVMIVWAWLQPSVWALVAGAVVAALLRLLASHTLFAEAANRFAWHRDSVLAILTFGSWLLINTPLGFAADQADRFAIGKLVTLQALGVYQVAIMIGSLPFGLLGQVGAAVIFPAFSRAAEAGHEIAAVYRETTEIVLVAGGLLIAGLVACGPPFIKLLYDERWHAASWMVMFIAIGQWFRILAIPGANALFAQGKPYWLVAANAAKLVGYLLFVPLGWNAAEFPGALAGFAAGESLGFFTYLYGMGRQGSSGILIVIASSLWIALSAASGIGVCRFGAGAGWHYGLQLVVAGGVVVLWWSLPVARILRRVRAMRAPA